jgi:hypothetical protein
MNRVHHRAFQLSLIATALLAACGGGGSDTPAAPTTVAITGVVADGALQGATVCYDLNDNLACDSGEPVSAATDTNGKYSLSVATGDAGKHAIVANVPATAIDKDTGTAVGTAFTLKSPASGTSSAQEVFVSALTTAVVDIAKDSGKSVADVTAQVKASLGLSTSPLADFTAAGGDANAALAAKALTLLVIETTQLATANGVSSAQTTALVKTASTSQLEVLAATLSASTGTTAAAKAAEASAAVKAELNLSAATVAAVAAAVSQPVGTPDAPGPFVSLRRFAYTDAANYSYTVFTGDSSVTDSSGEYVANEVRKTQATGADALFNRNQVYWTGSAWQTCALQWQVITKIKPVDAAGNSSSTYCGGSRNEGKVAVEDIAGKTMREVVTRIRAYPLADSVGAHTDAAGLPVKWGPDPALLDAAVVFPAGSKYSARSTRSDIGGTDRIELTTKSTVRWPDGVYRQATTLEQYGGMPGNLANAATVPANGNTVFVFDLPLAEQLDTTLEAFKRFRAGFDMTAMTIRFYKCDVRKSDQAALNCATVGDGTLGIGTQGDARLLKVATGYPAELAQRLNQQRFWAERSGTVFRGVRDLERTRYDQRLNATAWAALRTALGIPAHADAVAPAGAGPFETLRNFSFTDLNNYNYRVFSGDSSILDTDGYYVANEERETKSGGVLQPYVRNRLFWTGSEWYDCPSDGLGINLINSKAPFNSIYCKAYLDERVSNTTLTLAGRRVSDVVNDIRAYGSTDFGTSYGNWGPNPAVHTQLANTFFPAGATMEYRGLQRKATPIAIATDAGSQVRVAPSPDTTAAFNTWPYAASLDEFIAKYPGDLAGAALNGNVAFFVHGYDLAAPPSPDYTTRVEFRVAFDANGQKARFYQNNRAVTTNFTTNYLKLLDTTYTIETLGGVRVLKFAAMPDGFESSYYYQRMFAERAGGVWYAFKDSMPTAPGWSIRVNREAAQALGTALGLN